MNTTIPGARSGDETYPVHADGAWMTRLFGVITPLGAAEANALATAYASIAARVSSLEVLQAARKEYSTGSMTLSAGQAVPINHNMNSSVIDIVWFAELTVAIGGWAIGSVMRLDGFTAEVNYSKGVAVRIDTPNALTVKCNNSANATVICSADTGSSVAIPWGSAKFRAILRN